jgi:hypothetical protein
VYLEFFKAALESVYATNAEVESRAVVGIAFEINANDSVIQHYTSLNFALRQDLAEELLQRNLLALLAASSKRAVPTQSQKGEKTTTATTALTTATLQLRHP